MVTLLFKVRIPLGFYLLLQLFFKHYIMTKTSPEEMLSRSQSSYYTSLFYMDKVCEEPLGKGRSRPGPELSGPITATAQSEDASSPQGSRPE